VGYNVFLVLSLTSTNVKFKKENKYKTIFDEFKQSEALGRKVNEQKSIAYGFSHGYATFYSYAANSERRDKASVSRALSP
jgi:hypothetical protein